MDVEQAVMEYLGEFGNTKESDILAYVRREFKFSDSGAKKLIDRMEQRHQIFRVVHTKLHPPGVYLTAKEYIPLEIRKELIRAEAQVGAAEWNAFGGH
jgi:predicted transcriptional regulator